MIQKRTISGVFITGTDTGIGKTVVAGAIADWFRRHQYRVAVCKPVATGCERRREGLVSEDAEFLAACADASHPLDVICPQRYVEPQAPAVAAQRAGQPLDWSAIDRSLQTMSSAADVLIVEGVGGILVPLDDDYTVLDLAIRLNMPTLIVARPGLGTINHTLLTAAVLRGADVPVAGVVINRYPTDTPGVAEETNPDAIERWGRVPVLCVIPDEPAVTPRLSPAIRSAIDQIDWAKLIAK
ncbi:MAG: dethiobiotin synthase [Phycisphaerae bacterium]|nr:dethiobiotin synthase [Phycisphaerae bacterium]